MKIVFLIGISGSGKSTYASKVKDGYCISVDNFRHQLTNNVDDYATDVIGDFIEFLKLLIKKHDKVYVDGMFVNKETRDYLIESLLETNSAIELEAIVSSEAPLSCLARITNDLNNGAKRANTSIQQLREQYSLLEDFVKDIESGEDKYFNKTNVFVL